MSVAAHKLHRGLDAARGCYEAEPAYTLTHIDALLGMTYLSDAHLVACIMHDTDGSPMATQPRVNKGGLRLVEEAGRSMRVHCLVADVDNPGHAKWRSHEDAIAYVDTVAKRVPTAAVYATSGGVRIVQPLLAPLGVEQAEAALGAWLAELLARGIQADPRCVDWTRHFRAPHVVRDGKPYRSPAVVRTCQPVPAPRGTQLARRRKAVDGQLAEVAFVGQLPAELADAAARLTVEVAPFVGVKGQRHDIALALAGAICKRGVRPELVPALIGAVFARYSTDVAGRVHDAKDTARRYVGRLDVMARLDAWPSLELAVAELFGGVVRGEGDKVEARPLETVTRELEQVIRTAPDGVTMVKAQCGLGKTRSLRVIAEERAGSAKKLGSATAISVPTTALAMQVQSDLMAAGVPCARYFGPLSMPGPWDGRACKYHRQGVALARGGLSVAKLLCRGCDVRDTCEARDGVDGPDGARVAVGPHELVGELAEHAGKTGLLGIDEPPALLKVEALSDDDLRRCLDEVSRGGWFDTSYAECMSPIVDGALRWLRRGVDPETGSILRGLTEIDMDLELAACERSGATDAVGWADAAMGDHRGSAPPISEGMRGRLRGDTKAASAVGDAARVLTLLRRAVLDHSDVGASVEDHRGTDGKPVRRLVLVACERRMHAALRREGATLVLAADADVVRPMVARAVGYEPPLHSFRAPEVEVERVLLSWQGATRSGWLAGEMAGPSIVRALRLAVDWYLEGDTSRPLAIATYLRLETELTKATSDLGKQMAAELARCPSGYRMGHYGALRGLDAWKDLDALVSLGDPYPHQGTLERQAAWVSLGSGAVAVPEDWSRQHAAAELEQVHGRLRTVHRTRPARQLHVGRVVPAGWGTSYRVVEPPGVGRPRGVELEDVGDIVTLAGGPRAVAAALGVDRTTVQKWARGDRRPPPDVALRLIQLAEASLPEAGGGAAKRVY